MSHHSTHARRAYDRSLILFTPQRLAVAYLLAFTGAACGGNPPGNEGTGGAAGLGGNSGTAGASSEGGSGAGGSGAGGARAGSGGATGTGGAGTGGMSATGGRGMGGANGMGGAGTGGRTGTGGMTGVGGATGGGGSTSIGVTCTPQTWDAAPIGWATQGSGTSGAGANPPNPTVVTSASQLTTALAGTGSTLIHVSGKIAGDFRVGSNKTILGLCGAEVDGSLDLSNAANVIIRNLKVVGHNCTDSPSDCSSGHDAVHVEGNARNLWFDHMDISDGSDGNLDITNGANFVTVSWTIFHYSSKRTDPLAGASGHRFCNLIGAADTVTSDAGLLNTTFHHVWWSDNVNQRMPRVRFGKVHVFNSLYTATGDSACIEVGVSCNIRSENNVFQGVSNAVDSTHSNAASIIQSIGNIGSTTNINAPAFTPPYVFTPEPASSVAASVMAGAGVK
jgi:pectate lyase